MLGLGGGDGSPTPDEHKSVSEGVFWETLLLQAKANFAQADANLSQARANEVTSRRLHDQTWGWLRRQCAADVEPDRLESWYAAKDDAIDGVILAGHVAQQAEETWTDMRAEKPDTDKAIPDEPQEPKVVVGTGEPEPDKATPDEPQLPKVAFGT